MTDQHNTAPAVWDPTARGGAGGWVRNPQHPDAGSAPGEPPAPPTAGAVGDQGPPLGARPYLSTAPGFGPPPDMSAPAPAPTPMPTPMPATDPGPGAPTTALPRVAPPPPGAPPSAGPPAPTPFPSHATPQDRGSQGGQLPGPGYVYPPPPTAGPYQQAPYQQPPYPAQPDYPTAQPLDDEDEDDRDRPADRRTPLLIGFAVLLVLAVGGGLLYATTGNDGGKNDQAAPAPSAATTTDSGNPPPAPAPTGTDAAPSATATPSGSPSPTATGAGPNAKAQAQALDALLTEGGNARAQIGNAVAKVTSCPAKADIESAAQVFDGGAKQRDGLLGKLGKLSVTDLPGGTDAVNSLKSAWQLSADVDRAYASWARAVAAQGCSGTAPSTADKKHADELNPQATQAKNDFLNKWKPIATTYGLTPPTSDRI
ncbi:hypothetical protein [Kitasatospora cathayae]|uniref:Uncharacterized protein n=1 Tax=Kitasatospora cathayae TaxID=3004092 RepID=A0ABY7Q8T6_9ACTN|nr:hypothetical protein [Kitasatospora sp. HUAS 3-15]WBP89086.1 hypothetical protein O1G21_26765 [Kitasatospora sp. HUAS 3-15]